VDGSHEKTSAQSKLGPSTKAKAGRLRGLPFDSPGRARSIPPGSGTVFLECSHERRPRNNPRDEATVPPERRTGSGEVEKWNEERIAILRGLMRALAGADIREEVRRAGRGTKRS
jgi:hypothetical protein